VKPQFPDEKDLNISASDVQWDCKFIIELRKPGANQPLQVVAKGRFLDKEYPFDYAYGLMVGAGLTRCECGLWGNVEDLTENHKPIPCPH